MPLLLRRLMRGAAACGSCLGSVTAHATRPAPPQPTATAVLFGPHASAQRRPKEVIYDNAVYRPELASQLPRPRGGTTQSALESEKTRSALV